MSSANVPRIDHRSAGVVEIADIAGDDDQVVDNRGGRDQTVGLATRPQRGCRFCLKTSI
jgi:hypothetical protein